MFMTQSRDTQIRDLILKPNIYLLFIGIYNDNVSMHSVQSSASISYAHAGTF